MTPKQRLPKLTRLNHPKKRGGKTVRYERRLRVFISQTSLRNLPSEKQRRSRNVKYARDLALQCVRKIYPSNKTTKLCKEISTHFNSVGDGPLTFQDQAQNANHNNNNTVINMNK